MHLVLLSRNKEIVQKKRDGLSSQCTWPAVCKLYGISNSLRHKFNVSTYVYAVNWVGYLWSHFCCWGYRWGYFGSVVTGRSGISIFLRLFLGLWVLWGRSAIFSEPDRQSKADTSLQIIQPSPYSLFYHPPPKIFFLRIFSWPPPIPRSISRRYHQNQVNSQYYW